MPTNVGTFDRIARIVLGGVLIALVFLGPQFAPDFPYWDFGWIGAIFVATGIISFCPLYTLLGIRTCRVRN